MTKPVGLTALLLCLVPVHADEFGAEAFSFEMPFVTIEDPGNPDDVNNPFGANNPRGDEGTPYGGVGYVYRIAKYEVSSVMIDAYNALIPRHGGPRITRYAPAAPSLPASSVNWNEAARFVNWMNTSKGFPPAYKFVSPGGNDHIALWTVADGPFFDHGNPYRNPEAFYFLPSEDEWYKAAYFDPAANNGDGGYWDFATGSDTPPVSTSGGTLPGTAVYNDGINPAPELAEPTNAGGLSPYGTMGQNGNVWEWIESAYTAPNDSPTERRVARGGSWADGLYNYLPSSFRDLNRPTNADGRRGFRVAARVPSPPVVLDASAEPSLLWPPNRKLVEVQLSATVEGGTDPLTMEIVEIRCNERHSPADYEILDGSTVRLRAARRGRGSGRTYTIHLRIIDGFALASQEVTATVVVPHDKGKGK